LLRTDEVQGSSELQYTNGWINERRAVNITAGCLHGTDEIRTTIASGETIESEKRKERKRKQTIDMLERITI